jgi:hypothetical protein
MQVAIEALKKLRPTRTAEPRCTATLAACVAIAVAALGVATPVVASDYPTTARVDYVRGCMAANGQSRLVMEKCACSIDAIASLMPYAQYEQVETIMRMREGRGELALLFRTEAGLEAQVQEFKRVQVEADLRCF